MGITRKDLFTEEQNQLAEMAKVMGHPARIAILQHLVKINACCNGDLVNELGLAQATISQHLKELKAVGLIQGTIEGVSVSYCIHPENWEKFRTAFETLFQSINKHCCS